MQDTEKNVQARQTYITLVWLAVQAVVSAAGWLFYYVSYAQYRPMGYGSHLLVLCAVVLIVAILSENMKNVLAARRRTARLREQIVLYESLLAMASVETLTSLERVEQIGEDMLSRSTKEEDRHNLENILRTIEQARSIVEDFFDLEHLGDVTKEPVQIAEMLDAAIEHMSERPQMRTMTVKKQYERNIPEVPADPVRVVELFNNMIRTICHVLHGNGEIFVDVQDCRENPPDDMAPSLVVTVAGSKPTDAPPPAGPHHVPITYGIGLGLVVAMRIAELHGWQVKAETADSTVCVRLVIPA